jgi:hypothetical protein
MDEAVMPRLTGLNVLHVVLLAATAVSAGSALSEGEIAAEESRDSIGDISVGSYIICSKNIFIQ